MPDHAASDELFALLDRLQITHSTLQHAPVFRVEDGLEIKAALPAVIGSAKLSFGSAERLQEALGVTPGSVTLFALVNDHDHAVRLVLDRALLDHDLVNFHPLRNTATTAVTRDGMLAFLDHLSVQPLVVDFAAPGQG